MIGQLFDRFGVTVFPACVFGFATLMGCSFLLLCTRPKLDQHLAISERAAETETEELIATKSSEP